MPTDERCSGCPLCDVGEPAKSIDRLDSKFLVVTDTPSHFSANSGKLLSKSATTIFARTLSAAGFGKDDFSYHPAIRCPHDPNLYDTKQKTAIREHCRPFLLEKMEELDPEVVIPLGAEAARQVLSKAVKITKIRGVLNEGGERLVFPMLNPSMVAMYPQHQTTFTTDVATLKALHDTDYNVSEVSDSKTGDYELIDDLQFLVDAKPEVLFFDTETTGLQFFKEGPDDVRDYVHGESTKAFDPSAAVLTMQFCYKPGKAYMLVWDHPEMPMSRRRQNIVRAQLRKLLTNPNTKVIGFNSKYDKTYVKSTIGVDYRIGGDAQMLAVLLDENAIEKNQNILVKRYVPEMAGYDDYFNATYNKSKMWEVPVDEILTYGCGDVDSGLRLYNALFKEVQADPKLLAHYNRVSVPGLNALSSIEMEGLYVSEEAIDLLETEVEEVVKEQYDALIEQVPRAIKRLHVEKGLSFTRSEFLLDILFRHKSGLRLRPKVFTDTTKNLSPERRVPSVSTKQHLPYFFEDYPFVVDLAEHIKISRLLSANIKGFKKKYIINDRVRPTYSLAKTVTGRTSSQEPNGQNTPKRGKLAKAYRRIYVAPEGHYVLEADLSQAELRIAAMMANEPTMLRIYREGGDIHKETAYIVMGVTAAQFAELPKEEQSLARFKAKAVNFGFLYGMGYRKFIIYAKTQYGVDFTEEEAQRIRAGFFRKYSALEAWHKKMRAYAHEHGFVRSLSGRKRHLPMIYSEDEGVAAEAGRQAINSPVQEFGSSLGVMAMGRLTAEIDPAYLRPVAFVHDAIYCLVPKQYLDWGARTLKWYMETNPVKKWFGVDLTCPIIADVGFGENFGDTFELGGIKIDEEYDFSVFFEENVEEGEKFIHVPEQEYPENDGILVLA